MTQFAYRYPRFMIDLPVDFIQPEGTLSGRSSDISSTGIKALFPRPLERNSRGRIVVSYAGRSIDLQARVVYSGSESSGLEFVCETPEQQDTISNLIDAVAECQHRGVVISMSSRCRVESGQFR